jgi:hypothetical protein
MRWSRFFPLLIIVFATVFEPNGRAQRPIALSGGMVIDRLDYISGASIVDGLSRDRFALVAVGAATLPPGDNLLRVISDDGVRVWVGDALELDSWEPHESRVESIPLKGGLRRFKVHYYEAGGFAELRFDIQRR